MATINNKFGAISDPTTPWTDPADLAARYFAYQTSLFPPSGQVWPYALKTEQWIVHQILVLLSGCSSELFSIHKSAGSDIKIEMNIQVQISSLTPQTLDQALQYWIQGAVTVQQIQSVIDRLSSCTDLGLCYRAFGQSLCAVVHPFKRHIADLEVNRADLTLASLQVTLRWHMEQIKFIHSVVQRVILTDSFAPLPQRKHSTAERASFLLTALYNILDDVSRGDDEPFKMTLKLFLDSLAPLLNMVHYWMHEGSLSLEYAKEEFFVTEDELLDYQAPAVCWKNKFELRTKERPVTPQTPEKGQRKILVVPSFMKDIAQLILHTGKAIHLIQSMGKNDQIWTMDSQMAIKQSSQHPSRIALMTRLATLDQSAVHTCTEVMHRIEVQLTRNKSEDVPLGQPVANNTLLREDIEASDDEVMAVLHKLRALSGTGNSSALSQNLFKLADKPRNRVPVPVQHTQASTRHFDYKSVTCPIIPVSHLIAETLHSVVEAKYNAVNQYLLRLYIFDNRLLEHLKTLRQFFFLENGFVWHLFIKNVFDFLQDGTRFLNVVELNHMLQESINEDKSVPFSDLILIQLATPTMSLSSMNKTRINQTQLSDNATIDINVNQTFLSSQSVVAPVNLADVPATPVNRGELPEGEVEEVFIKNLNDTDKIRLSYRVSFPLDILLSVDTLAEYNNIMSFIFRIKRSKFVLDQLLFIHKETTGLTELKVKSASVDSAKGKSEMTPALKEMRVFYHKLNLFRGTLIHFVNNLQHYVATRVVEMAWNELADEIKSAKDFDYLVDFHQRYLSSIRDKCLLNKNVSRLRLLITRILDMAMVLKALYDIMPSYASLSTATKDKLNANYEKIVDDFNQSHKLLTTVLNQIVQQKRLPHLEDLLTKLNYNSYYNYSNTSTYIGPAKK